MNFINKNDSRHLQNHWQASAVFLKKDLKIGMKYVKINIVYEKKTQLLSKMNILENLQDQQVRNSGIIILNKCSKKVTDKGMKTAWKVNNGRKNKR